MDLIGYCELFLFCKSEDPVWKSEVRHHVKKNSI